MTGSTEDTDLIPPETDESLPSTLSSLLRVPSPRELRAELQAMVQADLLGPAGGDEEEIGDEAQNVRDRYILGVLAPRYRMQKESEPGGDELAQGGGADGDDGSPDTGAPQKGTMFPSSLGFTFHVAGDVSSCLLSASWGRYERVKSEVLTTEKGDPKTVWRRIPVKGSVSLPLEKGRIEPWSPCDDCPEVKVQGMVRRKTGEPDWDGYVVSGERANRTQRNQRQDVAFSSHAPSGSSR